MSVMTHEEASGVLAQAGFTVGTDEKFAQALGVFQAGWNLGAPLTIDEKLGPQSSAALLVTKQRMKDRKPTASEHFSFAEFTCQCHGSCSGCLGILVVRPLLEGLEKLRSTFYPGGLSVLSGYRCAVRNKKVGGKADSQHQWGGGCDIDQAVTRDQVASLKMFSGIFSSPVSGKVKHVDVRGVSAGFGSLAERFRPPRTTGGTPQAPTCGFEAT